MKLGFDTDYYLKEQAEAILNRAKAFGNKLYLEFGGKLLWDLHASRVLPGFDPNVKMKLLQGMKDKVDIVICIHAGDIERRKMRADFGLTYDADTMKLIEDLQEWGLETRAVVVTRFEQQPGAVQFINKIETMYGDIKIYTHKAIKGYPTDVDMIVSAEGYGSNPFIETNQPIVIVTAPGPGSGKLATCLSQLYWEHEQGTEACYAKFETFPIWNLPLKHPVNIAYESATADLADFNQIDPFHLEAYGTVAVNYNRDVEIFPVVKRILVKIMGEENVYKSPTDMGVNRAGFAIIDDEACQDAAKQELIRRFLRYRVESAIGMTSKSTVERAELIMKEVNLSDTDRPVVPPAREAAIDAERCGKGHEGIFVGAAIELLDGTIITGKNSPLLHAASSVMLNVIKHLAEIPDKLNLISPGIIDSVGNMKRELYGATSSSLNLEETLIALSISAMTNPTAALALEKIKELKGCEMHITHMPTPGDEAGLRRLGLNITSDPNFSSKRHFAI